MKATLRISNLESLKGRVIKLLMPKVITIVKEEIDLYLQDLEKHMGRISGAASYTGDGLHWEELDDESLEDSPTYWYKTGKAKQSISVNLQVHEDGVSAFVGIAENAPGYQEALWNELGFTPRNGDTIVRRPLFFPLAEEHKAIIEARLRKSLISKPITLEI